MKLRGKQGHAAGEGGAFCQRRAGLRRRQGEGLGPYPGMTNEELIARAKRVMAAKGAHGMAGLQEANYRLFRTLCWRSRAEPGLFERIGLRPRAFPGPEVESIMEAGGKAKARIYRRWASMGEGEFVRQAKEIITRAGIRTRKKLSRADKGLYEALLKRERGNPALAERIGLERRRHEMRDWKSMNDDEVVGFASAFVEEHGLGGRKVMRKKDSGLYNVLSKRGLLGRVFPENGDSTQDGGAGILERIKRALSEYGVD